MIDSVVSNLIPEERLLNCFDCLTVHAFRDEFVYSSNGYRVLQSLEIPVGTSDTLLHEIFNFYLTLEKGGYALAAKRINEDTYTSVEIIRDHFPDVKRLTTFFEMAENGSA